MRGRVLSDRSRAAGSESCPAFASVWARAKGFSAAMLGAVLSLETLDQTQVERGLTRYVKVGVVARRHSYRQTGSRCPSTGAAAAWQGRNREPLLEYFDELIYAVRHCLALFDHSAVVTLEPWSGLILQLFSADSDEGGAQARAKNSMITYKQQSGFWKLALSFSLLVMLAGCVNDGVETRKEPAKTGPQLGPQETEMLIVAAKGENARVKELLDKGVDVNMRGTDRNTPMMEAAYAGHVDTCKLLLDHGADLSAKKNDGASPGTLTHSKEVTELFKNVAALVDASGKGTIETVKELVDKGTPLNGLDQNGRTALTEASWNGKTDVVKLLLERGANPNIKKSDGETPLSLATSQKHPDIVALLNDAIAKQAKGSATTPAARTTPAAK